MSETNDGRVVLGMLEEGELQALNAFRKTEQECTYQIGTKQREILGLAMQAGEANQRMQNEMTKIRQRLEIPEGQVVQITTEGQVITVETPSTPPGDAPE